MKQLDTRDAMRLSASAACGPWRASWRRAMRRRRARCAAAGLLSLVLACAVGATLSAPAVEAGEWVSLAEAPNLRDSHVLGTDRLGRDVLVLCLAAGRGSLGTSALTALSALCIGLCWGLSAAVLGARARRLLVWPLALLDAVPGLLRALFIITLCGAKPAVLWWAGLLYAAPDLACAVRERAHAVQQQTYVRIARTLGATPSRVLRRHILPNLLQCMPAYASAMWARLLLAESALAWLGVGWPAPNWGNLLRLGIEASPRTPWLWLGALGALCGALCALDVLGTALYEAVRASED